MTLPLPAILDPALRAGLVAPEVAARVRQEVQTDGADPVQALALHGRLPVETIYRAIAADRGLEFAGGDRLQPAPELLRRLPPALILRKMVLPLRETEQEVLVAAGDLEALEDERLRETLRRVFDKPVRFAVADPGELGPLLEMALASAPAFGAAAPSPAADAVGFLEGLMREAFVRRASDIHLEPERGGYLLRLRVDGELAIYRRAIPAALALAALSRLKVLARMDIAENREPQDGSLVYEIAGLAGRRFDVRIATAPTKRGERATLRLLGTETKDLTLGALGFSPAMHDEFRKLIRRPAGLILLTGPTGCGKTTTLYAALREISQPDLNVMTVEDPVEYSLEGVSQLEIDGFGKVTFSSALRALLRHDPDVLMVGEIRDKETADMALRAAATGHLVFSTLHTNTAVGAVTRLLDLQCEPFMVAATLIAAVAQRLVRRLCPACRAVLPAGPGEDAAALPAAGEPRGCLRCQQTGFLGRTGIFEMFVIDEAAREAISRGADEKTIARAARRLTLLDKDAAAKIAAGLTTGDEVRRVVFLED